MKIAIDFDGTCVEHQFPQIGPDVPDAVDTMQQLVDEGHTLFLYTMRSGKYLAEAIQWFADNDITLSGINRDPEQTDWTNSPKCYAELYVDDAAFGAPLIREGGKRPYLDWSGVLEAANKASNPIVDL